MASGPRPRVVALGRRNNSAFVYALDSNPSDELAARVLCKVINRQRRVSDEPRRARLRCHWERDARRAALVLWPTGVEDPYALVQARIERIASGRERKLVDRVREPMRANMRHELRLPVELARRLAMGSIDGGDGGRRMLDELTGLSSLADSEAIESRARWIFQAARGVEVRRKQKDDGGAAKPASEEASKESSGESAEAAETSDDATKSGGGRP